MMVFYKLVYFLLKTNVKIAVLIIIIFNDVASLGLNREDHDQPQLIGNKKHCLFYRIINIGRVLAEWKVLVCFSVTILCDSYSYRIYKFSLI